MDSTERLIEAIQDLSAEWDAYIGYDDVEGHDDAVLVGEQIATVQAALADFLGEREYAAMKARARTNDREPPGSSWLGR